MLIFLFCLAYGMLSFFLLLLVRIGAKPAPTPFEQLSFFQPSSSASSPRLHIKLVIRPILN
jgi:hypothetical protein